MTRKISEEQEAIIVRNALRAGLRMIKKYEVKKNTKLISTKRK